MNPDPSTDAALAPVRRALLADAAADAAAELAAAEARATEQVAAARAQADGIVTRARADGAAAATAALVGSRARARRQARATVMRARRRAYEALRSSAREALRERYSGPGHRAVLDSLALAAVGELGRDAVTVVDGGGGVLAQHVGRSVDYGLDGFADRAVDAVGPDLEVLWTP